MTTTPGIYRCKNWQFVAVESISDGRAHGTSTAHGPMSWNAVTGQLIDPVATGWDLDERVGRLPENDPPPTKPTSSIHRLVQLIHHHPHARVTDRDDYHGIEIEARGRQVIILAWLAENPAQVHVNGHVCKCLWLLRECRERRTQLLGVEDRIAEIVDDFEFESATP